SPNPQTSDINLSRSLAPTYAQLLETREVLQGTIDALNLQGFQPDFLKALLSARIIENTSLLVISVTFTDPVLAADIANTAADQLILQSPTNLTNDQRALVDSSQAQIGELTAEVSTQRELLDSYESQLLTVTDQQEKVRLTDLRMATIEQINLASATIAQFQSTINSIQARANSIQVVERAAVPTVANAGSPVRGAIFGVVVGVALATGLVLFIEYLDDRIKTSEIATQVLALPVLGSVPRFGRKFTTYHDYLVTEQPAMSPEVEAYRRLRTNLLFAANSAGKNIVVVTSPGPAEGKSLTAANLAVTMAIAGMRVLLVDADLRRPKIHEIFNLPNEVGLTTLLHAGPAQLEATESGDGSQMYTLTQCLQATSVPRLKVITSGFIPANPTEILGSTLMRRWASAFRSAPDIDIVLIDTPPALMFSDSTVLASISDARVVMVLDSRRTQRRAALEVREQFAQLDIEIKGVIVNRVNPSDEVGRYGYGYYYYGPSQDDGKKPTLLGRLIPRRK
ncbi:MAG: polysaccharide biosynthesis tyrosine autokinase, partial [Anaerolineae bacterium]